MAIKFPKEIIKSGYRCYEVEIPKPVIETEKKDDGSFSLYAKYDASILDGFAKDVARDMSEKLGAKLIDELMRLNGYVPEKTCRVERMEIDEFGRYFYLSCGHMQMTHDTTALPYCPICGARVKEEE